MNDNHWFEYLLGVLMAVLGWLGKRLHDKVERSVSRAEFRTALEEFRKERREMHKENKGTLDRIHQRVDQLWERL